MRLVDPVTYTEAGHILGASPASVHRRVLAGQLKAMRGARKHHTLSRADVEALALQIYPHRRRNGLDPDSYWVTGQRAADIFGVNVARLNQLAGKGLPPYEVHADGTRLYRREQLMTVANAREARWH